MRELFRRWRVPRLWRAIQPGRCVFQPASPPLRGHSWCMKSTGMQLSRGPRARQQWGSSARRAATGLQEVARVVVGVALGNCLLQVACRSWMVSSAFSTAGKDTQGANWSAGMHARSWRLRAAGAQLPPPPPNPQALATTAMLATYATGVQCQVCLRAKAGHVVQPGRCMRGRQRRFGAARRRPSPCDTLNLLAMLPTLSPGATT